MLQLQQLLGLLLLLLLLLVLGEGVAAAGCALLCPCLNGAPQPLGYGAQQQRRGACYVAVFCTRQPDLLIGATGMLAPLGYLEFRGKGWGRGVRQVVLLMLHVE